MSLTPIRGYRDSFGLQHVTMGEKAPSKPDETKDHPLKIRHLRPTQIPLSIGAKILFVFQSLARLVERLWKKAPPTVYQNLYEEILIKSRDKEWDTFIGRDSQTLRFLLFSLKKDPSTPKSVIEELQNAWKWAKAGEKLDFVTSSSKIKKKKAALVEDIESKIRHLAVGAGCLIPCGPEFMVRVSRMNEGLFYEIEVLTRSQSFTGVQHATGGGKEKIRAPRFTNLTLNQVCNRDRLQNFVDSSRGSHREYDLAFKDILSHAAAKDTKFHYSKSMVCRVQNIWDAVHDKSDASKKTIARRKLNLKLEALFGYFDHVRGKLKPGTVAFQYLQEGLARVSRNTVMMQAEGYLTPKEVAAIQKELQALEKHLQSKMGKPKIPSKVIAAKYPLQVDPIVKHKPTITLKPEQAAQAPLHTQPPFSAANITHTKQILAPPTITAANALEHLQAATAQLKDAKITPFERKAHAIQFMFALPFDCKSDPIWQTLSKDQKLQIENQLMELSQAFSALLPPNQLALPEEVLALAKIATLTNYLAQLENAKLPIFVRLDEGIIELMKGVSGKRSFIAHSAYRIHSKQEQDVFDQILKYATWASLHRDFTESDITGVTYHDETSQVTMSSKADVVKRVLEESIVSDLRYEAENFSSRPETQQYTYSDAIQKTTESFNKAFLNTKPKWEAQNTRASWGAPFENPLIEALAFGCRVEHGRLEWNYPNPNSYTPEAIMDDPWEGVERAYNTWQLKLPDTHPYKKKTYAQVIVQAKPALLKEMSQQDLQAVMLALDTKTAAWNLLGLIKKNPLLLESASFRALFENQLLQPYAINAALSKDKNYPKHFIQLSQDLISQFKKQNAPNHAIYLIHMLGRFENVIKGRTAQDSVFVLPQTVGKGAQSQTFQEQMMNPEAPKLDISTSKYPDPIEFPDYTADIKLWLAESLKTNSPLTKERYFLLTEYLEKLGAKPSLSQNELKDYAILKMQWENTPAQSYVDPIQADLIRKQFLTWQPELQKAFNNENFRQHVLDTIFINKQIPLTQNHKWEGVFPTFKTDEWEIDLLTGLLVNLKGDAVPATIPNDILFHPHFKKIFPQYDPLQAQAKVYKEGNTLYYHFGHNLIKKEGDLVTFYKKHQNEWLQYLPSDLENYGMLGENNSIFVPMQGMKGYVFDVNGKAIYQCAIDKKNVANHFISIDPDKPLIKGCTAELLDLKHHPELRALTRLANSKDILLWHKKGKLTSIEIMGLNFTKQKKKLICATDPFKGYQLEVDQRPLYGLPAGLSLVSGSVRRWLLPHFSGSLESVSKPAQLSLLSMFRGKIPETATKDRQIWKFTGPANYWVVDSEPAAMLDLFKYLISANTDDPETLQGALDLYQNLETVDLSKFPPLTIEKFSDAITTLAKTKNGQIYALKAHMILHQRVGIETRSYLEKNMVKLIPDYFATGKHVQLAARLTYKEELAALGLMMQKDTAWFEKHGQLLAAKMPQEDVVSTQTIREKRGAAFKVTKGVNVSNLGYLMIPDATYNATTPDRQIAKDFRKYYQIAAGGPGKEFNEALAMIKTYSSSSEEKPDEQQERMRLLGVKHWEEKGWGWSSSSTQISAPDFSFKVILQYLEAIYDIKVANPTLELPPMDEVMFTVELPIFIKKHYPKFLNSRLKVSDELDMARFNKAVKTLLENPDLPVDAISEEYLVEKLAMQKKAPMQISKVAQAQDALFSKSEIGHLFEEVVIDHRLDQLQLKNKRLDGDIAALKQQKIVKHRLKSGDTLPAIIKQLTDNQKKLKSEADIKQASVLALITPEISPLMKLAQYQRTISWDEMKIAFLQNDLESLKDRLPKSTNIEKLKQELIDYYKTEVKRKTIVFVLKELEEVKDEADLLLSPHIGEKIYSALTRERPYDTKVTPEILVMENYLGFMIRPDQLDMASDFIEKPNCVRQALTGAGKTSVVMPLVGLCKANGQNLVTLKFLDPLFKQNFKDIQALMGTEFKKKVLAVNFSLESPLFVEITEEGAKKKVSIFKQMYEDAQKVILNKGILITDKKSFPLLLAKMIEIYDRLAGLPADSRPKEDLEHLRFLGKLLCLLQEREETIYDEFDKFLSPKEEMHLRLEEGNHVPPYVASTLLEVYDLLLQDNDLALVKNTQAELPQATLDTILKRAAEKLATEWQQKKGLTAEYRDHLAKYILGEEEFTPNPALNKNDQDQITLQKDLVSKILRSTLTKTADLHYILSDRDKKSVIPSAYADIPKEGSEYEDVRVKLCYAAQYYYQKGPSLEYLEEWIQGCKQDAMAALAAGEAPTYDETLGGKRFKALFPNASLEQISKNKIKELHQEVKSDPKKIRELLAYRMQEMKLPGKRITLNPHNQVSIAHVSAGTSATVGCTEGLHRSFERYQDTTLSSVKMVSRMLQRLNPQDPLLRYRPDDPKSIIPELLKQDPKLKVVIDGAGALHGMAPATPAKFLKEAQPSLKAVGFFDRSGHKQVEGASDALPSEKGQIFSHDQARGANVPLPASHQALLLQNGRAPLEEVNQNEGRLRKEDQRARIAIPTTSPIQNVSELIDASLDKADKDNRVDLHLSKQQEMQDMVHSQMVKKLANFASLDLFDQGFDAFARFSKHPLLVSQFQENWHQPGNYHEMHKDLKKSETLEDVKKQFRQIAVDCNLPDSVKMLDSLKLAPELLSMEASAQDAEKEVHIEVQQEAEVETEVETEIAVETQAKKIRKPLYLPWDWFPSGAIRQINTGYDSIHPSYKSGMWMSYNFLPLSRNIINSPSQHREPHDKRQTRLHYVAFIDDMNVWAIDQLDLSREYLNKGRAKYIYDTHLNRYIGDEPKDRKEHATYIAQMRFEDGQFTGYTDDEWEALTKWIQSQPHPKELEDYLLKEVLRHRPNDRARYPHSKLAEFFRALKKK